MLHGTIIAAMSFESESHTAGVPAKVKAAGKILRLNLVYHPKYDLDLKVKIFEVGCGRKQLGF